MGVPIPTKPAPTSPSAQEACVRAPGDPRTDDSVALCDENRAKTTGVREEPTGDAGDEEAERRGVLRWLARLGAGVLAGGWLWGSLAAGGHGPRGAARGRGRGRAWDTGLTIATLARGGRPVAVGPVVLIPTKTYSRGTRGGTKGSAQPGRGSREAAAGMQAARSGVGVRALDRRCTHLGCPVAPDPAGGDLACPCHGSRFDLRGHPTRGPAKAPLPERRVTVDGEGRIWVHGRG
jgi:nitrite reductase/ring-hydroxylating ferredoxin subunit